VHKGVTFLLEHLPPRMHLVIATRTAPPLPLSGFRGRRMMLEIGVNDLRFTTEEAGALLKDLQSHALSPEEVSAINERAEGWAVGLTMAALSMSEEKDVRGFISRFTGSQRWVMDYLADEVLKRQSDEMQDFLLKTSVLERLTGSLCDFVSGQEHSQRMLEKLDRANLFLIPLDESREWYRYHHLFGELLLHRLETESGDEAMRELHRKASHWFEERGLKGSAISHSLAARDWERALELILGLAPNLVIAYGHVGAYNWLRQVPEDVLLTRPLACRYYATTLVTTGKIDAAKAFLDRFEKAVGDNSELAGYIAGQRCYIALQTLDPRTEEFARKALSLMPQDDFFERGIVSFYLAIHYQRIGRLRDSEPLAEEAYRLHSQAPTNMGVTSLTNLAALAAGMRGEYDRAEEICREALRLAGATPNGSLPRYFVGRIHYLRNELESAAADINEAIPLSRPLYAGSTLRYVLALMVTRLAQGDVDAAGKAAEEAEGLLTKEGVTALDRALVAGYRAALAEAQGDDESVANWLDRFSDYQGFMFEVIPASTLRLVWEKGGEKGRQQLAILHEVFSKERWFEWLVIERIHEAVVSSEPEEAVSLIGEALSMARPGGVIRHFADWGISLAPLLRQAISHGIEPEFARKVLDIIEAEDRQRVIRKGEIPASPAATGILTDREVQVLRLVADGLSNQEIAAKLVISGNTAKTHVRHVFDKLDAKDRLQAVNRAKELKLL